MRYVELKVKPWSAKLPWWCEILKRIIPAANPDFEKFYPQMTTWWIEVDDKGVAQREIGFDADMKPTVLGPFGRNYGFITDSSGVFDDPHGHPAEIAHEFERVWDELAVKFSHLK